MGTGPPCLLPWSGELAFAAAHRPRGTTRRKPSRSARQRDRGETAQRRDDQQIKRGRLHPGDVTALASSEALHAPKAQGAYQLVELRVGGAVIHEVLPSRERCKGLRERIDLGIMIQDATFQIVVPLP